MGFYTFTDARKKPRKRKDGEIAKSCKINYGEFARVVCPDGTYIDEPAYDGDGMFGGKDIYELVMDWNRGHVMEYLWHLGLRTGNIPLAVADAFDQGDDEKCQRIAENAVKDKEEPEHFARKWKRCIGIAISFRDSDKLPFPIKIINKRINADYYSLMSSELTQ